MKKYGEVVGSEKKKNIIRIYKERRGELYPTSLTVTASAHSAFSVGDMVVITINAPKFIASTALGYLLPFMATALMFLFISPVTDNLLIIEAVLLLTLLVTYVVARFIASLPFFRRINICTITEKIEIE